MTGNDEKCVLAFDLRAPLCAWGTGGVSTVTTQPTPTWSAIAGMIGAALGIERGDSRLVRIAQDYGMALRVVRPGDCLSDYHTIANPKGTVALDRRARTRRDEMEMSGRDANTTITRREYMSDAHYRIFIVPLAPALHSLESIKSALRTPVYPLYAGRRSCVLGRIESEIVAFSELEAAEIWDERLHNVGFEKPYLMRIERRDLLIGPRVFGERNECIA